MHYTVQVLMYCVHSGCRGISVFWVITLLGAWGSGATLQIYESFRRCQYFWQRTRNNKCWVKQTVLKIELLTPTASNLIVFCCIIEDVNQPGIFCVHLSWHCIKKLPSVCPPIMLNHPAQFQQPRVSCSWVIMGLVWPITSKSELDSSNVSMY